MDGLINRVCAMSKGEDSRPRCRWLEGVPQADNTESRGTTVDGELRGSQVGLITEAESPLPELTGPFSHTVHGKRYAA